MTVSTDDVKEAWSTSLYKEVPLLFVEPEATPSSENAFLLHFDDRKAVEEIVGKLRLGLFINGARCALYESINRIGIHVSPIRAPPIIHLRKIIEEAISLSPTQIMVEERAFVLEFSSHDEAYRAKKRLEVAINDAFSVKWNHFRYKVFY